MFQTNIVEKITAHILCSVTQFSKNRTLYEIIWKNTIQPDRTHMTIYMHAG
jgi:hypothetical protein